MKQLYSFLERLFLIWSAYFCLSFCVMAFPVQTGVRWLVGVKWATPLKWLHTFILNETITAKMSLPLAQPSEAFTLLRLVFYHSGRVVLLQHMRTIILLHMTTILVPILASGFWQTQAGLLMCSAAGRFAVYLPYANMVDGDLSDMPALEDDCQEGELEEKKGREDHGGYDIYDGGDSDDNVWEDVEEDDDEKADTDWETSSRNHHHDGRSVTGISILDRLPSVTTTSESNSSSSASSSTSSASSALSVSVGSPGGSVTSSGSHCSPGYGTDVVPLHDDWLVYDETFGVVPIEVLKRWNEERDNRQATGAMGKGLCKKEKKKLPPVRYSVPRAEET